MKGLVLEESLQISERRDNIHLGILGSLGNLANLDPEANLIFGEGFITVADTKTGVYVLTLFARSLLSGFGRGMLDGVVNGSLLMGRLLVILFFGDVILVFITIVPVDASRLTPR